MLDSSDKYGWKPNPQTSSCGFKNIRILVNKTLTNASCFSCACRCPFTQIYGTFNVSTTSSFKSFENYNIDEEPRVEKVKILLKFV